jgi:hypothetical protein
MTDPMMHLRSLVDQTPDADILRDIISFAAERLMEMEVGGLTGAGSAGQRVRRIEQRRSRASGSAAPSMPMPLHQPPICKTLTGCWPMSAKEPRLPTPPRFACRDRRRAGGSSASARDGPRT